MSFVEPQPASCVRSFRGEIGSREHFVQFYDEPEALFEALADFTATGLRAGEGVVLIATPEHQAALDERLAAQWLDAEAARERRDLVCLDAEATLARFMVENWP